MEEAGSTETESAGSLEWLRATLAEDLSVARMRSLWRGRTDMWDESADVYLELARKLLRKGEPFLGYDVVSAGLRAFPDHPGLRQVLALALARMGAAERASEILEKLAGEGFDDEQTLGLLARTYKDLGLRAATEDDRARHFDASYHAYKQAYEASHSPWTGINSATLSVLTGRTEEAEAIAEKVFAEVSEQLAQDPADAYWLHATLGEAALIKGRLDQAEHHYGQARRLGASRVADLATTRRQMRLLARHLGTDCDHLDAMLSIPRVVVFSGHMIDRPDRAVPRFPPSEEARVAREIRDHLERMDAGFGFASAACGADILFLEAMMERGGETNIFLPHSVEEFRKRSVDFAEGWGERYDNVIANATRLVVANLKGAADDPADYAFVNLLRDGSALLHARTIEASTTALAVWDGNLGDGFGGTDSAVTNWQGQGIPVELIAPLADAAPVERPAAQVGAGQASTRKIVALIFADVVGYSGMPDEQVPAFVNSFMKRIADMIDAHPVAPLARNTWGDAIYLVYDHPADAFEISAALRDLVRDTDWAAEGLPAGLNLRIGLHAGPVFSLTDPVTGQPAYTGAQVSRAARIEPIAPPGEIYASESFAALAAAHSIGGCVCNYVGEIPLAKGYGSYATYHVQRAPGQAPGTPSAS